MFKTTTIYCLLIALVILTMGCSEKDVFEPLQQSKRQAVAAAVTPGSIADSNIRYFGRWDYGNVSEYASYWGGAYVRMKFTGTTAKVKLGNVSSNFYVKIDNGPWVSYYNVGGTVDLTPTPLAQGTHIVTVAQGKDYDYVFKFQGFILDSGASTSELTAVECLIEYIGDSITAGYMDAQANVSDYAWVCAEALGCEHTQIAFPGKNLVSGYTTTGMDVQFFKQQNFDYPASPDWDFTKYTAKIVVINLGQNDYANNVPDALFQSTYISFLANIRAKYPNAEIFAVRTFLGWKATPTQAAVAARNAAGDTKVHYINTDGWITPGTADYVDGVHPSVSGHIKVANLLSPILAPYVNGAATVANGTYKIINRKSGLALDVTGQLIANGTRLQQWTYNGGDNQRWVVTNLGNGQYKLVGVQSGRCVDVNGQLTASGTAIQLWDYAGGDNQKWIITPTSEGYYTITGVQSGKPMEVTGESTANGAQIELWDNNGGTHQQWIFQAP